LVKMTRHHFFLLCFNFFSHGNSLGISVCIYQFSGSDFSFFLGFGASNQIAWVAGSHFVFYLFSFSISLLDVDFFF